MSRLPIALSAAVTISDADINVTATKKTDQTKAEFNASNARADGDYDALTRRCKDFSGNDRNQHDGKH